MREFDLTIFDTTATNSCTDAQRVATVSGYSLVVARKHKSHVKDVATLSGLLRADRSVVVGTVLNDY
jgi:protein-tyrosine kinase